MFGTRQGHAFKTVAVGGHLRPKSRALRPGWPPKRACGRSAPTTATPTGKFYGKLCARSIATSARFDVKFFRRAAEPSAACGGCSEAEQGQRSQNASAVQGAPHDAGTATRTYTRGNSRVRRLPCAAVAPCAACRGTRHAAPRPMLSVMGRGMARGGPGCGKERNRLRPARLPGGRGRRGGGMSSEGRPTRRAPARTTGRSPRNTAGRPAGSRPRPPAGPHRRCWSGSTAR